MKSVDRELSDRINKILSEGIVSKSRDFYSLAFFLTCDRELAEKNIKDCVSAGLYNARRIQTVPPVKPWFYQELVALCKKRKASGESDALKAFKNDNLKTLSEEDVYVKASFAMYYFEGFSTERIANILRTKEENVDKALGIAEESIRLTSVKASVREDTIADMRKAYFAVKTPVNYKNEINEIIEREKELNKKYFGKEKTTKRIRFIFGVIILIVALYLLIAGR